MKLKTMKWSTVASLILVSLSLSAQEKDHHEKMKNSTPQERATKLTDWMKTNLKLNDNQVAQVQAINLKYAQQNEGMKDETKSKEDKMKTMKETEQARDAELKGVLTADQYKDWEVKKSHAKGMAHEKMKETNKQ